MTRYDRRAFLGYFSSIGLGSTLLPGVLWARAAEGLEITAETVACAEELVGMTFTPEQRQMMVDELKSQAEQLAELHAISIDNAVSPALVFDPVLPGMQFDAAQRPITWTPPASLPAVSDREALAFAPVTVLAELIRTRRISSVELTRMYLERLKTYDPVLLAVITLTEDRALRQARQADAEIARGDYRGPLHGIPWGAKDLLAVRGYPTTWGTEPYRGQSLDYDAEIVQRLDRAGAVLLAKLTLGELAYGDVWFGGRTRNPWKPAQGSSGSSAGSAAATAAGLVGFAIGSETLGSISSPSTRVGATGLRPTFGRIPRTGAMALSWTMDKLGPICRSVEDCALVLAAVAGPDGEDMTVRDVPFNYDGTEDVRSIRVGYFRAAFERDYPQRATDEATLNVLRSLGIELIPVEFPDAPYSAMRLILTAEAAAAFEELTRTGGVDRMKRQTPSAWPNTFRAAQFIPAVDYINANRVRTTTMRQWAEMFRDVDVIVTPTFHTQLTATNFTGHPAVILPNGFREDGTPVSITFLGKLFGEGRMLRIAGAYQQATDFHLRRPVLPTQPVPEA